MRWFKRRRQSGAIGSSDTPTANARTAAAPASTLPQPPSAATHEAQRRTTPANSSLPPGSTLSQPVIPQVTEEQRRALVRKIVAVMRVWEELQHHRLTRERSFGCPRPSSSTPQPPARNIVSPTATPRTNRERRRPGRPAGGGSADDWVRSGRDDGVIPHMLGPRYRTRQSRNTQFSSAVSTGSWRCDCDGCCWRQGA
jgi:hypothetical protein